MKKKERLKKKKEYDKQYYLQNKEKYKERTKGDRYKECKRKHYIDNKASYRRAAEKYRDSGKAKIYLLKRKYNLSFDDYNRMFKEQKHSCKICKKHKSKCSRKHLKVDHNHKTGEVRGLLCDLCNRGLGYFKDNPKSLQSAIKYLKSFQ